MKIKQPSRFAYFYCFALRYISQSRARRANVLFVRALACSPCAPSNLLAAPCAARPPPNGEETPVVFSCHDDATGNTFLNLRSDQDALARLTEELT